MVGQRVEGDDGRGFGEAVALPDGDADRGEPLRGVDAERGAAGDKDSDAAAERLLDFGIDQLVGQLPHRRGGLASAVDMSRVVGADARRPRRAGAS